MYKIVLLLLKILGSNGIGEGTESLAANVTPFICTDGARIDLSKVCNGAPDCPDTSDELRKLCHHVVCPESYYRCRYGACIEKTSRCDGFQNCVDGSDEFRCDLSEACSDREYHCLESNDCIPIGKICNGYADCPDSSDESETLCTDHPCPLNAFNCAYGGCINRETICNGFKDCVDGSDEETSMCAAINCQGSECLQYSCRDDEFRCANGGQCIPASNVCDGSHQCRDASDEQPEVCSGRNCNEGYFQCDYGACIPESLKCNSQPNCHDWSDENESICGVLPPDGACRLPLAKPATHYLVPECDQCRPGQIVPELTRVDYTCDASDFLEGSRSTYCLENRWTPNLPSCISDTTDITCHPVDAPGAIQRCNVLWGPRQGWIDCNSSIPVGTHVTLECPDYYERESGSTSTTCLHDGTWSQQALRCRPICGIRESSQAAALIIKGWELIPDDALPWHATLFSHENGQFNFFCGGSLISERAVLTAGHCVWKTDPATIKVVLAGFSSNFTEQTDSTQIFDVESIKLQNAYQDHEGNYGSDVAIIVLDKSVTVNSNVRPVCLDRSANVIDVSRRIGEVGLVAGMGITENDTFSAKLRVTSVKLVSEEECRQSQQRDFRKYVTYTSFCAGWQNGSAVCNGDSGGGLVLANSANSTIWEVHGIVSISPRRIGTSMCDPNYYTVFTKVSIYSEWIFDILSSYPVTGPPKADNPRPNNDFITFK